jgi:sugar/nucleoside kinase (ribokinase family)
MKKTIDLCGIGNSLVDIQVNVDDALIEQLQLKKGEMKLSDTGEQEKILAMLKDTKTYLSSGGSAANTIIAFSKFGGKASYMSLLGNDDYGKFYANEFKELDIDLKAQHLDNEKTGTCLILITTDSERTMCTNLAATGKYSLEHLDMQMIEDTQWLYIEGYKFSAEASTQAVFKAVEYARRHNTKIAITFSDGFITSLFKEQLAKVAEQADLIFCNENEAMSFTGAKSIDEAFDKLAATTPNLAVTLGSKGSRILWKDKRYDIPPYTASPVDSTGAGDMYAAGFLYGVIKENSPVFAGHLGSYAAARIVSQLGARLKENHAEIVNQIKQEVKTK